MPVVLAIALVATLALAPSAPAKLIVGDRKANTLVGAGKRDDIFGRGGWDVLVGRKGPDRLYGQAGDDVLLGEAGWDRLYGGGRDDTLYGGAGRDRLYPGWGTDVVEGGPGNDVIWAAENDASMDSIDCGPGVDKATVNRGDRVFNCETVVRRSGRRPPGTIRIDRDGANVLDNPSWTGRDYLVGLGGNDLLNGHGQADILWGNEDDDTLIGDLSPDYLLGGSGNDWLWGDDPARDTVGGRDRIWGGPGLDHLRGGPDNDYLISVDADNAVDDIDCGPGRDRVVAQIEDHVAPNCQRVIRIPD